MARPILLIKKTGYKNEPASPKNYSYHLHLLKKYNKNNQKNEFQ